MRIGSRRFVTWRFGSQIDARPVTNRVGGTDDRDGIAGRRVAGYLAKYVTKSAADFGLGTHRVSPHAIATLPVSEHVRRILHTIAELARRPGRAIMLTWLHCLGFRGHITTKTRRYSTTLQALRARRFRWQTMRNHLPAELDQPAHIKADDDEPVLWEFRGCGHATNGERLARTNRRPRRSPAPPGRPRCAHRHPATGGQSMTGHQDARLARDLCCE